MRVAGNFRRRRIMPNVESTDTRLRRVIGALPKWRVAAEKELEKMKRDGMHRIAQICARSESLLVDAIDAEEAGRKQERLRIESKLRLLMGDNAEALIEQLRGPGMLPMGPGKDVVP